eukprot:6360589-Karenia_brevis.AAC.1
MDGQVWEKTLDDVDAGCLVGPYTPQQVSKLVGSLWVGAFRFGINQAGKVRPVDDFSQFLQNMTVGKSEKVTMLTLDDG